MGWKRHLKILKIQVLSFLGMWNKVNGFRIVTEHTQRDTQRHKSFILRGEIKVEEWQGFEEKICKWDTLDQCSHQSQIMENDLNSSKNNSSTLYTNYSQSSLFLEPNKDLTIRKIWISGRGVGPHIYEWPASSQIILVLLTHKWHVEKQIASMWEEQYFHLGWSLVKCK